jgi:hypothetical protein
MPHGNMLNGQFRYLLWRIWYVKQKECLQTKSFAVYSKLCWISEVNSGLKRGGRRWQICPERRLLVAIKKIAVHPQGNVKPVIFELELMKMKSFRG